MEWPYFEVDRNMECLFRPVGDGMYEVVVMVREVILFTAVTYLCVYVSPHLIFPCRKQTPRSETAMLTKLVISPCHTPRSPACGKSLVVRTSRSSYRMERRSGPALWM